MIYEGIIQKKHEMAQELKKKNSLAWKENRIIYIDGQIYIPNNKKLQEQVLQKNYNLIDVSYSEQQRMLELIKKNYW